MQFVDIVGIIIIILIVLLVIIGCFYLITKENAIVLLTAKIIPDMVEETPKKTFVFVGDIMMDRGVEYEIKKNNNNYSYPFEKISEFLNDFDIVFGNLEGPIVENPPVYSDSSFRFAFNKLVATALSEAGFNG